MPLKSRTLLLALFIYTFSLQSFATSIDSETTIGSTSTEESITVDGDLSDEPKSDKESTGPKEQYPWSLNFSQTAAQSTDPTGAPLTDTTNALTGTFGFEAKTHFELGGGYAYSATPNENLVSLGPSLYIGYTFEEAKHKKLVKMPKKNKKDDDDDDDDDDDFQKSIGFKFTFTNDRFVEAFTATEKPTTKKGKAKPTTGVNEIIQTAFQLEVPIKAYEWVTIKPGFSVYKYNTDVNNFLDFIDSQRLALNTGGLQNSAASFASYEIALQTSFYFLDSWEILLDEEYSKLATDDSNSWYSKILISDDIGDWRVGLGYSNLTSVPANDNAAILKVSYDF